MRTLRWILAIPAGFVVSLVAGFAGSRVADFIGGASWYIWLVSGVFSAASFFGTAFLVAPARSKALTWVLAAIVGLLGAASAVGSLLLGKDRAAALAGLAMVVFAVSYAQVAMLTSRGREMAER